jgi:hypothetical protein
MTTNKRIVLAGATIQVYSYLSRTLNYGNSGLKRVSNLSGGYETWKRDEKGRMVKTMVFVPSEEDIRKKNAKKNRMQETYSKTRAQLLLDTNSYAYQKSDQENYAPVMLTLTTKENISDLSETNPHLELFFKRINYELLGHKGSVLKTLSIPEWQQRGAVHYHTAVFNMPFVAKKRLDALWGLGHTWITRSDRVRGIGRYMTKYMTKGFNDPRFVGHNRYLPSQGLIQPTVIRDEQEAKAIESSLPQSRLLSRKTFKTEWQGEVQRDEYFLGDGWNYHRYLEDIGTNLTEVYGVRESF